MTQCVLRIAHDDRARPHGDQDPRDPQARVDAAHTVHLHQQLGHAVGAPGVQLGRDDDLVRRGQRRERRGRETRRAVDDQIVRGIVLRDLIAQLRDRQQVDRLRLDGGDVRLHQLHARRKHGQERDLGLLQQRHVPLASAAGQQFIERVAHFGICAEEFAGVPLAVRVDQDDALLPPGQLGGEVDRSDALSHAALVIHDGNGFHVHSPQKRKLSRME